jgi:glycosyltransferase involved in cell wall biosynthesis
MRPAVTVIVPAYNAARTIDRTLASVRAQTFEALEILVIDDGSRDDTAGRAARHAGEDARIRLIRQDNGGVAAARNHGIAEATAPLIAPVDADDLWSPAKIEKQVAALKDDSVGLVYCWYDVIDDADAVTDANYRPREEGDVLARLCLGNFIGNGSTPLIRRDVLLAAGGYDQSLRARRAQGCEDYSLYLRLAERSRFALVPEPLVGYRVSAAAMSGDLTQMYRSARIVAAELRARRPDLARAVAWGEASVVGSLFRRASFSRAASLGLAVLRHDPILALRVLRQELNRSAKS